MATNSLVEREHESLFQNYERLPIGSVLSAEGRTIHTDKGDYLDLISGLGVNALGYSHPKVVKAIQDQAAKYLHLSNLYLQSPQVELAEKVRSMSGFDRVFFCNSGTEAIEGAIKLVRKYGHKHGKFEVIGFENSFHGRTFGALSIMDKPKYRDGFTPLVSGMHCVSFDALERTVSERTAGVVLEVIQGEGGIKPFTREQIDTLLRLRERYGFLIVADEIQSGIGRTGQFFAYEAFGFMPDVVVAAKGIGGGLPLGAIIANNEVAATFSPGVHGTTFGGNSLACVAGSVVLDELASGLMDHVNELSEWFFNELHQLATAHPKEIGEIRGKGLMIGIDILTDAKNVQNELLAQHIVTNITAGNVLRLLPPLTVTKEELQHFLTALASILSRSEVVEETMVVA